MIHHSLPYYKITNKLYNYTYHRLTRQRHIHMSIIQNHKICQTNKKQWQTTIKYSVADSFSIVAQIPMLRP